MILSPSLSWLFKLSNDWTLQKLGHCSESVSNCSFVHFVTSLPFPFAHKSWTHRLYSSAQCWLLQSFSPWNHLLECYTDCLQLAPLFVSFCETRLIQNSPRYCRLASPLSENSVVLIHHCWRVQWLDQKLSRPVDERLGEFDCRSNLKRGSTRNEWKWSNEERNEWVWINNATKITQFFLDVRVGLRTAIRVTHYLSARS